MTNQTTKYTCGVSGCGADMTEAVYRARGERFGPFPKLAAEAAAKEHGPAANAAAPGVAKPITVTLQCLNKHWCEYTYPSAQQPTSVGRPLSEAEVTEFETLRKVFNVEDGIKKVTDFAQWLFGGAAIVGTLGAAFSNSAFAELSGLGLWTFAAAVICVGISLVAATYAWAPKWVYPNLHSRDSMLKEVSRQFQDRRGPVRVGSFFFAAALVLAAISPLLSHL
jgi:hypothetical protein